MVLLNLRIGSNAGLLFHSKHASRRRERSTFSGRCREPAGARFQSAIQARTGGPLSLPFAAKELLACIRCAIASLSAATFISLPIGTYDKHRSLNLGSNRWQNDLQVDFTQGFLDRFTVDVSGDWIYYGNNNEAGTANQRLSQDSTYGAYVWVTYDVTSQVRHAMPTTALDRLRWHIRRRSDARRCSHRNEDR
jgi:hypothetical protein